MTLTSEAILKATDIPKPTKVKVPEWGGDVFVRVISGVERDRWELIVQGSNKASANFRASLGVLVICDQNGKRVFGDGQAAALGNKSAVALDRIFEVAIKINKLKEADLKELEKN